MAKRQAIDSIYRQTKAASTTAKSKAGKTVHRQSVKTAKTFKTTHYISEAAQRALEHERHERRVAGKRAGSDFSSLVDAAILKTYKRRDKTSKEELLANRLQLERKLGRR